MADQRIKGLDAEIQVVVDGAVQATLTEITNFEVQEGFEIKEEGYVGEKSNRYDEVYKGVAVSLELHHHDPGWWALVKAAKDRAQRRTPGTAINIKVTLNYPNGTRQRIMIPNVFIDGDLGMAFAGRTDYGTSKLSAKAEAARYL